MWYVMYEDGEIHGEYESYGEASDHAWRLSEFGVRTSVCYYEDEPEDYMDDDLEMGFDPYMGCYDWDC